MFRISRFNTLKRFTADFLSGTNKTISSQMGDKPVETSMRTKLIESLTPKHIDVINESFMHNVPKGSETHFKVVVVSEKFENVSLLERHRMVNKILQDELGSGVHALSIVAKTPTQWGEGTQVIDPSPTCRGGFGK